jgi:glutaminase
MTTMGYINLSNLILSNSKGSKINNFYKQQPIINHLPQLNIVNRQILTNAFRPLRDKTIFEGDVSHKATVQVLSKVKMIL